MGACSTAPSVDSVDSANSPETNTRIQILNCSRCLETSHHLSTCTKDVRCRACLVYGHVADICRRAKKKSFWKRKIPIDHNATFLDSSAPSHTAETPPPSNPQHDTPAGGYDEAATSLSSSHPPPHQPQMANFVVNPDPFTPWGMDVEHWVRPTRLASSSLEIHHEDMIATVLQQCFLPQCKIKSTTPLIM